MLKKEATSWALCHVKRSGQSVALQYSRSHEVAVMCNEINADVGMISFLSVYAVEGFHARELGFKAMLSVTMASYISASLAGMLL